MKVTQRAEKIARLAHLRCEVAILRAAYGLPPARRLDRPTNPPKKQQTPTK